MPLQVQLRVVLDTNVLLSLWVFADSRFALLRDLIVAGRLLPLTDQDCLAEFERVLGYPEFSLDAAAQCRILAGYSVIALSVVKDDSVKVGLPLCHDADDQKFLELARDGCADALVTSDKQLLKLARRKQLAKRFRIVTPERFLSDF